jgi:hypothetical protein
VRERPNGTRSNRSCLLSPKGWLRGVAKVPKVPSDHCSKLRKPTGSFHRTVAQAEGFFVVSVSELS